MRRKLDQSVRLIKKVAVRSAAPRRQIRSARRNQPRPRRSRKSKQASGVHKHRCDQDSSSTVDRLIYAGRGVPQSCHCHPFRGMQHSSGTPLDRYAINYIKHNTFPQSKTRFSFFFYTNFSKLNINLKQPLSLIVLTTETGVCQDWAGKTADFFRLRLVKGAVTKTYFTTIWSNIR